MFNKNILIQSYGHISIARKLIMKRALELHNKLNKTLSEALKQAWSEAKHIATEYIQKFIKNIEQVKYKLTIQKQIINLSYNKSEFNADLLVDDCLEKIEEYKGQKFAYNVSKRINSIYSLIQEKLTEGKPITFAQDIYVLAVRT